MSDSDSSRAAVAEVNNLGWDPRVRAFRFGSLVDSFAVLTKRYTVLVDTLVNPEAMAEVLRLLAVAAPERPQSLLVINTHGDWDHVWGNGLFAGPEARVPAPIIGSRLAVGAMQSVKSRQFMAEYKVQHPGKYDSVRLVPPTIALDGGGRIDGGDLTLELIPSPGHTPDHLVVWIPEVRLLLAGDAAEASMPYVNSAESLPQLRATLRELLALDPLAVLACHAVGNYSPDLLIWNLRYFDELEARCRAHNGTVETLLAAWPLDIAVPQHWQPAADGLDFYTASHARASAAMLDWVRSR